MLQGSFPEGGNFRREWVIRGRKFAEGMVEVTATRFDRYVGVMGLNALPKAKRGESDKANANSEDSVKRAKQQVRLRCKAIGADRMITLTYRENMMDKERLKRDFDALRRRLRAWGQFHYVAVAERQKRGAWHLHIALRGRQNYRVLRAIWQSIVGEGMGQVNVRNPFREKGLRHKLAGYLAKYIGKGFETHELNEKRYWTSRGVVVPEALPIDHITSDDPVVAMKIAVAAAEAVGASMARCQMFWNQGLGVFWLSTRET